MPRIEWDESFSVGNAEIDAQHKKWLGIYNEMHEKMVSGDFRQLEEASKVSLQEMCDYVRYHFNLEEEYMQKKLYPEMPSHVRMHKDFSTQLYNYNRDVLEGKLVLDSKIMKIIKNWLLDHILVEDMKYSKFISGKDK